jgi:hypothetical protein
MKNNILRNFSFLFSAISLVLGETLVFALLEKNIFTISFSRDYLVYLILIDVILFFGCSLFLYIKKILIDSDLYKLILPILINIGFIFFVYFSFSFWADQIVLFLVFLSNIVIFGNIGKKSINPFNNFISFFASFLLFFSIYSIFYNSFLPYWLLVLIVDLFLLSLVYYDLKSFGLEKNFLFLSLIIFTILLSEFFLFSFFLPINSILLKGLFMTLIYYLYWSGVDSYLNKKVIFWNILKNLITFVFLVLLIGSYLYLRGDLK